MTADRVIPTGPTLSRWRGKNPKPLPFMGTSSLNRRPEIETFDRAIVFPPPNLSVLLPNERYRIFRSAVKPH